MEKGILRRAAIIDAAQVLFDKKGYEQTSVDEILGVVGLSKGGFYHHFASKEQLLRAVCEKNAKTYCEVGLRLAGHSAFAPLDRFNLLFDKKGQDMETDAQLLSKFIASARRGYGGALQEALIDQCAACLLPVVEEILLAGREQGAFYARQGKELAPIVTQLYFSFFKSVAVLLASESEPDMALVLSQLSLYRAVLESVLGAPYGSVLLYDFTHLQKICQLALQLEGGKAK